MEVIDCFDPCGRVPGFQDLLDFLKGSEMESRWNQGFNMPALGSGYVDLLRDSSRPPRIAAVKVGNS